MADVGKTGENSEFLEYFGQHPVRCLWIFFCDESSYLVKIGKSVRSCPTATRVGSFFEAGKGFFAIDQGYVAVSDTVVGAVEHRVGAAELMEISGHGVSDQVVGFAAGLGFQLFQAR
ncbi:MAG TPA: hypothetical protein VK819_04035 [Acidobacteriaceae bacterium]|jgi:hypothetical protein|nr:hypothetical protein [Acidobacteriaceae bacterium]